MVARKVLNLKGLKGATILVELELLPGAKKPYYVQVRETNGKRLLYERKADSKNLVINLPRHGDKASLIAIGPKIKQTLIIPLKPPTIPFDTEPEVKRPYKIGDFKIIANPNLPSPARMFTKVPVIEYNPRLLGQHSEPVQTFVLYHEVGHYYFDTEELADRWAITRFLNDGYNMSSANYGLTHVLNKTPRNISRMAAGNKYLKELDNQYYKTATA